MTPAERQLGTRTVDIVAKQAAKVVTHFHFSNRGDGAGFDGDIVRIVFTISMWPSDKWGSCHTYIA